MTADVVIVGGGIAGCACAYYLAREGAAVHLVERGPLGSGASRAGMSHVVTWEEPEPHLHLARASQRLYEELQECLPVGIEYRRTGSLVVVENEAGLQGMEKTIQRLRAWGLECEFLSEADLRRVEPGLAPGLAGGALFPGDGQVNPLLTTQGLAQAARALGAVFETSCEVTGVILSESGDRVGGVETSQGRIPAGHVVIAAGAWSAAIGQMAGVNLPVKPRKGHLVVTSPVPDDLLHCKVILSAGYMDSVHGGESGVAVAANIQQVKNGNLLLGSSRQFAGFDLRVEPDVAREVIRRCLRFLPGLSQYSAIRMWTGLRPYTPDLLPIIGAVKQVNGLYIATGHEGIGITEAPITGRLISQVITGSKPDVGLEPFRLERFAEEKEAF